VESKRLAGKRILVVDDEVELRTLLKEELELEGAQVEVAQGGDEAFEIFRRMPIDAILSDVRMPSGDGISLLERVRASSSVRVVFIMITGYSGLTRDELISRGLSAFFSKPFDMGAIINTLCEFFRFDEASQKRKHERIPFGAPLSFYIQGNSSPIHAQTENLSEGGMFVRCEGPLPELGAVIEFKFEFIASSKRSSGVIRWARVSGDKLIPQGFGVEFTELSDRDLIFQKAETGR